MRIGVLYWSSDFRTRFGGTWSSWELRQIETARTVYLSVVTELPIGQTRPSLDQCSGRASFYLRGHWTAVPESGTLFPWPTRTR